MRLNCDCVVEKFLRYVKVDTASSEETGAHPSTESQKGLGRLISGELKEMGASDVFFDEKYCYVYAKIPANDGGKCPYTLAFISHMDTSPEVSGKDVRPHIVRDYDGGDIDLSGDGKYVLSPSKFPALRGYKGMTLITTDGSTLLGADDKAGVAEIMSMAEYFLSHPEEKHGNISICFTPDEEIGEGVDNIDMERLGADYGYTVDGGAFGEIEYENFNAASAVINISGVSVHPGDAKDKMVNASLVAVELCEMLPKDMRPENTENYEGFFHLCNISGGVDKAELSFIIRDHDFVKFTQKKDLMTSCVSALNEKYGKGTLSLTIKDQYYNMKEKIEPDNIFLVENAKKCMLRLGVEPVSVPIRGGTDGARLSFMGLPCPNLPTGGQNYHGRFEYACVESMLKCAELLIMLASFESN